MSVLLWLSELIIPLFVFCVVGYGMLARIDVYDCFVRGARSGLETVVRLIPTMIGLMVGTGVLRASGFLDFLARLLYVPATALSFPPALIPLVILRMFSSSAATGLLLDLYKTYGPDSTTGLIASLLMCCTETIFYTMSVYFMAARIRKTRYTLQGALLSTLAGIIVSVFLGTVILTHI